MAKLGRPKKGKYDDLPGEFKDLIDNSDEAQCRKTLAEVGIAQDLLLQAKKADQHLEEVRKQYAEAGEMYRTGSKANKMKTSYIVERLQAMGKA